MACSLHSDHNGEVGVYRRPDASANDSGAPIRDATEVSTPDAGGYQPDVFSEPEQDAGQCVSEHYVAVSKPLDIYLVLDASAVEHFSTLDALEGFASAPESHGIRMGVNFFGPDLPCAEEAYLEPAIPIAFLPDSLKNLRTEAALHPDDDRPTLPALQGAIQYARAWAQFHPDSAVVVWLITDDLPDDCDSTVDNVAQAAAAGLSDPISVPTYVIGIGNVPELHAIAQAGGTERAIIVDTDTNRFSPDQKTFLIHALNQLREAARPCEHGLPSPERVARELVNFYVESKTGAKIVIPHVDSANACDPTKGGWFYEETRTRIIACDKSCETLKASNGEVSIEIGCPTVLLR
jgi:hypothetical protein